MNDSLRISEKEAGFDTCNSQFYIEVPFKPALIADKISSDVAALSD
jgi:hypothetical protein